MRRRVREYVFISVILGFVIFFISAVIIVFNLASATPKPQITISNLHPCLHQDDVWSSIESFDAHGAKYICADMKTDRPPAELTLMIEPVNGSFSAYVYDASFNFGEGSISFLIRDNLPPGAYRARILYARDTLAYIYFNVDE